METAGDGNEAVLLGRRSLRNSFVKLIAEQKRTREACELQMMVGAALVAPASPTQGGLFRVPQMAMGEDDEGQGSSIAVTPPCRSAAFTSMTTEEEPATSTTSSTVSGKKRKCEGCRVSTDEWLVNESEQSNSQESYMPRSSSLDDEDEDAFTKHSISLEEEEDDDSCIASEGSNTPDTDVSTEPRSTPSPSDCHVDKSKEIDDEVESVDFHGVLDTNDEAEFVIVDGDLVRIPTQPPTTRKSEGTEHNQSGRGSCGEQRGPKSIRGACKKTKNYPHINREILEAKSGHKTCNECRAPEELEVMSPANRGLFSQALNSLTRMKRVRAGEATAALHAVGPPYGLQEAARELRMMRQRAIQDGRGILSNPVGMKIRKSFNGREYIGRVAEEVEEPLWKEGEEGAPGEYVKVWRVVYDEDGDIEDMDWSELFRYRYDRPRLPAPCRGRALQCLELFCGQAVVSQEFCDRRWKVASIDVSESSNATIKMDICDVRESELPFVPDFVWASLPCEMYSRLAGGKHRSPKKGELGKTPKARKHDYLFLKMAEIMRWARAKHSHLVVVIENPVGSLQLMPLMKEFSEDFGLHCAKVDYCAFGRDDKKPTMLWTNDFGLKATLAEFTCTKLCPVGRTGQKHPISVRTSTHLYDFSVIPLPLAEEVADYVSAKFYIDRIRTRTAASPDDEH